VLPSTQQRWLSRFNPAEAGTDLVAQGPEGCNAALTWLVITMCQDNLPTKDGHLSQRLPGGVMDETRTPDRKSQVQCPNH